MKLTLNRANFIVGEKKQRLKPRPLPGFDLDLGDGLVYVSEERCKKLLNLLNKVGQNTQKAGRKRLHA